MFGAFSFGKIIKTILPGLGSLACGKAQSNGVPKKSYTFDHRLLGIFWPIGRRRVKGSNVVATIAKSLKPSSRSLKPCWPAIAGGILEFSVAEPQYGFLSLCDHVDRTRDTRGRRTHPRVEFGGYDVRAVIHATLAIAAVIARWLTGTMMGRASFRRSNRVRERDRKIRTSTLPAREFEGGD